MAIRAAGTLIDRLVESIVQVARHQPGEVPAPAAILWTDADGQCKSLVEQLLQARDHEIAGR
jgi:hypothetical protein